MIVVVVFFVFYLGVRVLWSGAIGRGADYGRRRGGNQCRR